MHTQANSDRRGRQGSGLIGRAIGVALYVSTLALEAALGASLRWLLVYISAAIVGIVVPLGLSVQAWAWIGALVPLVISVLSMARPGRGRFWRLRIGARRPSRKEQSLIGDAIALLRGADPDLREPSIFYVLDEPLPLAAARGRAVALSRGLLESESLPAVLAHELGHLHSLDARLTEALDRLVVWDDPLGPSARAAEDDSGARGERGGALLFGTARLALRLAGGGVSRKLLSAPWGAYWRGREYVADRLAASLGPAEDLARHLHDLELPFEAPRALLPFDSAEHPPVALRIERLHAIASGVGPR